jgi:hypothetical protein
VAGWVRLRSRAAYLLVRDRGGAIAGCSAAALLGADCAPRGAPAEVVLPGAARRHPGQRDAELAGFGWRTSRLVDDDVLAMPQTVRRVGRLLGTPLAELV